ncbi:MAG TPA: heat shock protein HspQ [Arenibaculum sp.]|nr:heat shock protein HspQ [Arenibaculum sp.]
MTMKQHIAKFTLGDVVKHRHFPFRGVIFDVDPEFSNTDDWYEAIPAAVRPRKDQPFYHLYAVNPDTSYVAYVSEQNLLPDSENGPVEHPMLHSEFAGFDGTRYRIRSEQRQ